MSTNLNTKERAYVGRAVAALQRKFLPYRSIEIDYVVALRVEGVVPSWGLGRR